MQRMAVLAAVAWVCCLGLCAEEKAALNEAQAKKAAQLLTDLGSDSFDARNKAEAELATLGAGVLPLLKEAVAKSADAEVKNRGTRLIKKLALEAETDPEALAALGREEALAKRYAEAEKFYARAATLYKELAAKATDEAAKKDLSAKAQKADTRQKRAQALSGVRTSVKINGEDGVVAVGGGAGAGVMVMRAEVSVSSDGKKADEDW